MSISLQHTKQFLGEQVTCTIMKFTISQLQHCQSVSSPVMQAYLLVFSSPGVGLEGILAGAADVTEFTVEVSTRGIGV